MPARNATPPPAKRFAPSAQLDDPTINRVVDSLRREVQDAQSRASTYNTQADLVVGVNAVQHSLGRAVRSVIVTPTVADAAFAWCLVTNNPHPDRQVLIQVIGVGQPGAYLEFR